MMWRWITSLRDKPETSQRGFSMVELVTTISLLSIFMAFAYAGVDSVANAFNGADRRVTNLNEARVLMGDTTKDIRTATRLQAGTSPFVIADSREITFYANVDPTTGPKKIHLYVDSASRLVSEITSPDAGTLAPNYTYTGTPTVRYVGRYIVNPTSEPIFTYLDDTGTAMTNVPLNSADLLSVTSVKIALSIRQDTALQVAATTLVNTVRLPNVDYQAVWDS